MARWRDGGVVRLMGGGFFHQGGRRGGAGRWGSGTAAGAVAMSRGRVRGKSGSLRKPVGGFARAALGSKDRLKSGMLVGRRLEQWRCVLSAMDSDRVIRCREQLCRREVPL